MLEVVFSSEKPLGSVTKVITMFEEMPIKADFLNENEVSLVKKAIKQADFKAQKNDVTIVYGGRAKIILLGLGHSDEKAKIAQIGEKFFEQIKDEEKIYLACENDDVALNLAYGIVLGSYSFDKYKTEKKTEDFPKIEQVLVRAENASSAQENFKPYVALATGVRYCKDLCNEPANYLTPEVFAKDIERLVYLGFDIEVWDKQRMTMEGINLINAVGMASVNEPKMVVLSWRGNRQQEEYDLALVGKGICFDAGGMNLKKGKEFDDMKMDMSGAAAVVAVMKAVALQRIRKNVVAIVGLAENVLGPNAMKVGDVYASYCGKTVEIVNTDAEGRLIVADCLSYVQKNYKVKKIISIASLGAMRGIFGNAYAGLTSNDDHLAKKLIKCGDAVGEKLWRMPLDEKYEKEISSNIADVKNLSSDRYVSVAALTFLNGFICGTNKWAHIDIDVLKSEKTGLSLGFGVKLLNEFIKDL